MVLPGSRILSRCLGLEVWLHVLYIVNGDGEVIECLIFLSFHIGRALSDRVPFCCSYFAIALPWAGLDFPHSEACKRMV